MGILSVEAPMFEPQLHPVYFDNSNSFSDHFDVME